MAVKAQASITLTAIVDVKATYRYYLLQSSTLNKPLKPTVYPPPSIWDDVEPTYQPGSTNSLYFVDCTVFSDDTFAYSEVSLSTAYEAAKLAYNAALEAQESAGDALDAATTNTEDLTAFQNSVEIALDGLQGQIDGSIMTWFYEYVPTNENEPASEWTTTDLKNNHLGDLFYDTITGYCYRWQVQNNEYSWQRITDVDVTKALADAAKAQDTADDKRRVFVGMASPTPPYDVGDLWAQGSTGELMKCKIAKTSGQSYAATDWEKASKYTDDSKADQVQNNLDIVENTVTSLSADFDVEKDKIAGLITKTNTIETNITTLEGDIATAETNITNLTSNQTALTQTVNGISQTVSQVQSEQTTINNNISGLQTSITDLTSTTSKLTTDLNGITATVSQHTSELSTINGEITDLDDRLSSAELKITPDAIIQTVSGVYETKENVGALTTRVTAAESQIQTNADNIALRVTTEQLTAAKNEAVEDAVATAKTYTDTAIQLSEDNITLTVSETYATKEENEENASAIDDLQGTVMGTYEPALDDDGNPIQAVDEQGQPVVDEEGNPVYEQVYVPGLSDDLSEISSELDNVSDGMDTLGSEIDDVHTSITGVQAATNDLINRVANVELTAENFTIEFGETKDNINAWFDFGSDGILSIGQSDQEIISQQGNDFYAFVNTNTGNELLRLDTTGATVSMLNADEIKLSTDSMDWAIRVSANGNLNDVWIGG